jgi:hypothetical protein
VTDGENRKALRRSPLDCCGTKLCDCEGSGRSQIIMSPRIKMLIDMLTPLSLGPEAQLQYLHGQGIPECIDDLAEDYNAIAVAADSMLRLGELTQEQHDRVRELDDFLGSFSGQANAQLWTPEALRSAPEWEQVRKMASHCLALLKFTVTP